LIAQGVRNPTRHVGQADRVSHLDRNLANLGSSRLSPPLHRQEHQDAPIVRVGDRASIRKIPHNQGAGQVDRTRYVLKGGGLAASHRSQEPIDRPGRGRPGRPAFNLRLVNKTSMNVPRCVTSPNRGRSPSRVNLGPAGGPRLVDLKSGHAGDSLEQLPPVTWNAPQQIVPA
jgi:hypothetical protein